MSEDNPKPSPVRRSPRPRRPAIPGLTDSRVTYWVRRGYLRLQRELPDKAPGRGNRFIWPPEEQRVAADMLRLLGRGLTLDAAHKLARQGPAAVAKMLDVQPPEQQS